MKFNLDRVVTGNVESLTKTGMVFDSRKLRRSPQERRFFVDLLLRELEAGHVGMQCKVEFGIVSKE